MSRSKSQTETLAQFLKDTAEHLIEILRDDGVYRHLRFRKPGTYCYGFDIVTWPGHLAITGDMGESLFARTEDMLQFFRADPVWMAENPGKLSINPGYWAEKCKANDGDKKEFREDQFRDYVREHFEEYVKEHTDDGASPPAWAAELWEELEQDVLISAEDYNSTTMAIGSMTNFKPGGDDYKEFHFSDAWGSANSLQDYTHHFIWRLYAIAYAVRVYDAAKAPVPA